MAVAYGTAVYATPTSGTGTIVSPSITTPTTEPVVFVLIASLNATDASSVIDTVTMTGFGGTSAKVADVVDISGVNHARASIWKITAPTGNTAGTVTANAHAATGTYLQMEVCTFSGAHQTDPSPVADAVTTDGVQGTTWTLTAANLAAADESVACGSSATNNIAACTGTGVSSIKVDDTTNINFSTAYATGTNSITFNIDFNADIAKVVARVRASGGGITITATPLTTVSPILAAPAAVLNAFFILGDASLDGGLDAIKTNANQIYILTGAPTSYADAVTKLVGAKNLGAGNVLGTIGAGSPSGRIAATPAVTGGTVSTNGTPAAWAIVNSAGSVLYASGPLSGGVAVTTDDNWTLDAITLHMNK